MPKRSRKKKSVRRVAKSKAGRRNKGRGTGRKSARKTGVKRAPARAASRRPGSGGARKPSQRELSEKAFRMASRANDNLRAEIPHDETPHSPSPALSERPPSSIPQNPREQGDTANILQNTTNKKPSN